MRKFVFLLAVSASLILASCGRNPTPDNKIHKTETRANGYRPDGPGKPPIEIIDTTVTIAPTWQQANRFASQRGDFLIWQIIGWLLILAGLAAIVGHVMEARWLPNLGKAFNVVVGVLLVLGFMSIKWQSAWIKWNNYKSVPKTVYDQALRTDASTRPIWDSLENNCQIVAGPYGCYKSGK
jgi:hypothetical protein